MDTDFFLGVPGPIWIVVAVPALLRRSARYGAGGGRRRRLPMAPAIDWGFWVAVVVFESLFCGEDDACAGFGLPAGVTLVVVVVPIAGAVALAPIVGAIRPF